MHDQTQNPVDEARLEALAMAYVARFATSEARLAGYLRRKAWRRADPTEASVWISHICAKLVGLGLVDDRSFADMRARSLVGRGFGARRIGAALYQAGINEEISGNVIAGYADQAPELAADFARRRRIGPYSGLAASPDAFRKALGRMMRAGHDYAAARAALTGWEDAGDVSDRTAFTD